MTTPPEPPAVPEPTAQPVVPSSPVAQPAPQYAAPQYAAPPAPVANPYPHTWMNVVSLVTSIIGLSLAGIIFGHLGVSRARKGTADLKGLGIAGLIIGYIGLIAGIILVGIIVFSAIWVNANCETINGVSVCT